MLTSQFSNIRRTQFDQSSLVQPVSESRGGSLGVTDKGRKSSCLILDMLFRPTARCNCALLKTATAELKYICSLVCLHFLDYLMVSGLCLPRSRRSITTSGPSKYRGIIFAYQQSFHFVQITIFGRYAQTNICLLDSLGW